MYSTSSSISSSSSVPEATTLLRYRSAPSSLLTATVDSAVVIGIGSAGLSVTPSTTTKCFHFVGIHESWSPSDFSKISSNSAGGVGDNNTDPKSRPAALLEERSYSFGRGLSNLGAVSGGGGGSSDDLAAAGGGGTAISSSSSNHHHHQVSSLIRHSSSPAGLLNHLASDSGFTTKGFESYFASANPKLSGLSSELSFTKNDSLSQFSDVEEGVIDGLSSRRGSQSPAMAGFTLGPWDENNSIMFNAPPFKQTNQTDSGDVRSDLSPVEPQYNLLHTALDLTNMERLIHIPQDSVPCKIRAKRGFATHPRSIAERERRTRISEKLKKLQELVPHMDKQTSYADMLDLAVQYIKGLQSQIQELHKELEHCKCGCKPTAQR